MVRDQLMEWISCLPAAQFYLFLTSSFDWECAVGTRNQPRYNWYEYHCEQNWPTSTSTTQFRFTENFKTDRFCDKIPSDLRDRERYLDKVTRYSTRLYLNINTILCILSDTIAMNNKAKHSRLRNLHNKPIKKLNLT